MCIDIFSRYVWAFPLKTKNSKEELDAFKSCPICHCVISDNEFDNKDFSEYCKSKQITQQFAIKGDHHKLGIVDRMTLTLKNIIYKRFIGYNDVRWKEELQNIVKLYNKTPNAGIYNYTPDEAMNDKETIGVITAINAEVQMKQVKKINEINVGDDVRIRDPDWTFKRGYTPKWSEDIHKIDKRIGSTIIIDGKKYKIVDVQKGKKLDSEHAKESTLKVATKKAKVEKNIKKEGIEVKNVIEYGKNLVGRKVKDGKDKGVIFQYDRVGPYHWNVRFDRPDRDNETMNLEEIKRMLI